MTPWETKVLTGYLDHEVGHLRWTNWNENRIQRPLSNDPEYQKKLLTHYLYNVFEDVRMENQTIEDAPPIRTYLDAVEQQLQYNQRKKEDEPQTKGAAVLAAIYHEAYSEYRQPDIVWEPGPQLDQFPQLKPVREAMKALKGMKSTAEAADLAERVYDLLPKDVDYGVEAPETSGVVLLLPGENGEPVEIPIEDIEAAFEETDRPEALRELLQEIEAANNPANPTPAEEQKWGDHILPPADTSRDKLFVPTRKDRAKLEETKATATDQIKAARRMLNTALRARTQKAWERGLPEGQLDEEDLPSLFTGNTNMFKERRTKQMVDTALQLMVDLSGSMPTASTREAAIIMAEALTGIRGIKLSIAGFKAKDPVPRPSNPKGVGRLSTIEFPLFKDFEESSQSGLERLGALRCLGGTPLGDAFALGFERLMPRKEPRRVLWIITDGDPSIAVADLDHNEFMLMERTYRRCQEMNIKLVLMNIGLEINKRAKTCADAAVTVSDRKLLPGAMLDMTRSISL